MLDVVVIGAGKWATECWVPLLASLDGLYTVRAVADRRPGAARALAHLLDLRQSDAFTELSDALHHAPAARAGIVLTSPHQHAPCIVQLAERGLHVLTEKPLTTSADTAQTVWRAVHDAGVKLAVVQNYRYEARVQALRQVLRSGELGELNYLVVRLAADYRQPGSWDVGEVHTMDDPLLVEGVVHHLDMVRYLTGRDVDTVAALTRNPAWSSFAGACVGAFLLRLDGGAFALYEANLITAGVEDRWHREYYRAECQNGSAVCAGSTVTVHRGREASELLVAPQDQLSGHRRIAVGFAEWVVAGGPPVETHLDDNLASAATVFASQRAAATNQTVPVPRLGPGVS